MVSFRRGNRSSRPEARHLSEDAKRQEITARDILLRLASRPGVILADEVGMGKTFVALAVAASVSFADRRRRPVVVMVPPSLKDKWPLDFGVFVRECLPRDLTAKLTHAVAETGADFLKLIDDPISKRKSIIFLTHGAMHRGLGRGWAGGWIKLAVIQRALHHRKYLHSLRKTLYRRLGDLLGMGWIQWRHPDLWEKLLDCSSSDWLELLLVRGIDPEGDDNPETDDDPVPKAVVQALKSFDSAELDRVIDALHNVPVRDSDNYQERLGKARWTMNEALKDLWRDCLRNLRCRLPLLVLDEAHHLKNPQTRFASLFQDEEADQDAREFGGELKGIFERMLFLTATPFQLGHHELCQVLDRFGSVSWQGQHAPRCGLEGVQTELADLRALLDEAQHAAAQLDQAWGRLTPTDLTVGGKTYEDVERWWQTVKAASQPSQPVAEVLGCCREANIRMRAAEAKLRPWVIRHLRSRELAGKFRGRLRRRRLPGQSITNDVYSGGEEGLELPDCAVLPFLLAARATVSAPESRPVFAEGLASSYEAFLHTRRNQKARSLAVDGDAELIEKVPITQAADWYLNQLQRALPLRNHQDSAAHPKVNATAARVLQAWQQGEKIIVFCHFIETGRTLRRTVSGLLHDEILRLGAEKLRCSPKRAAVLLDRIGKRFFDVDSPVRRACDQEISSLLKLYPKINHRTQLRDTIRRYIRTPSFLVRFIPLNRSGLDANAVRKAFYSDRSSGMPLRTVLEGFLEFLQNQCTPEEQEAYINEIFATQTGEMIARKDAFDADELAGRRGRELLLPNVRLVNGATKPETRRRLMLTFNSPFFPEILIASSVMAEGVDLHRFCRYVIHHDLDWNPSSLEQRTGRLDRIGAKVERCGEPIHIYLPYIAETQDEKMYRVVMDRERWFAVVMGEKFTVDGGQARSLAQLGARATDRLSQRIPLPTSLERQLAFRLEVAARMASTTPSG